MAGRREKGWEDLQAEELLDLDQAAFLCLGADAEQGLYPDPVPDGKRVLACLDWLEAAIADGSLPSQDGLVSPVALASWVRSLGITPFPPPLMKYLRHQNEVVNEVAAKYRRHEIKAEEAKEELLRRLTEQTGRQPTMYEVRTKWWPAVQELAGDLRGRRGKDRPGGRARRETDNHD